MGSAHEVLLEVPQGNGRTRNFRIGLKGSTVSVDCACLRYWEDDGVRHDHANLHEDISVVSREFIGMWKIDDLEDGTEEERAKALLDLYSLHEVGCSPEKIVDAFFRVRKEFPRNLFPSKAPPVPREAIQPILSDPICLVGFHRYVERLGAKIGDAKWVRDRSA